MLSIPISLLLALKILALPPFSGLFNVMVRLSKSTFVGFRVNITGTLQDMFGNGLNNETVVLHYTFSEISTWTPITSDTTDNLGNYNAVWIPPATGSFVIKTEWAGNQHLLEHTT